MHLDDTRTRNTDRANAGDQKVRLIFDFPARHGDLLSSRAPFRFQSLDAELMMIWAVCFFASSHQFSSSSSVALVFLFFFIFHREKKQGTRDLWIAAPAQSFVPSWPIVADRGINSPEPERSGTRERRFASLWLYPAGSSATGVPRTRTPRSRQAYNSKEASSTIIANFFAGRQSVNAFRGDNPYNIKLFVKCKTVRLWSLRKKKIFSILFKCTYSKKIRLPNFIMKLEKNFKFSPIIRSRWNFQLSFIFKLFMFLFIDSTFSILHLFIFFQ